MEDNFRELTETELHEIAGGWGCGCDDGLDVDIDVDADVHL
jgi:hypothetical protein